MARIDIEGRDLVVQLTALERIAGFLGEVRVPLDQVESVNGIDDPWPLAGGLRIGAYVPRVLFIGRIVRRGGVHDVFAVRGVRHAVVVTCRPGARIGRIVVTDALPEFEVCAAPVPAG